MNEHPLLYAIAISLLISVIRVVRYSHNVMHIFLESLLCGVLTCVTFSFLSACNLSNDYAITSGGVIGFMGGRKIRAWLDKIISRHLR